MSKEIKIPLFRLFTLYCLAFIFGIGLASFPQLDFGRSAQILLFSMLALFLAAIFNQIYKNKLLAITAYFFIFLLLGAGYYSRFDQTHTPLLPYGEQVSVEGQITAKPDVDYKKQNITVRIDKISQGSTPLPGEGSLILVKMPRFPVCHYGDKVKFEAKIEKPGKIEDFDWGKYLKRRLIFGVVLQPINAIAYSEKLSIKEQPLSILYKISDQFEQSLNRIFPEPEASLAAGLILGIKRNIPDDLMDDLNVTGLTHIIALSGYNITIIITVISSILLGRVNRKQVFIIGAALIFGFVLLTGASSSVIRAAIFSLLIIFGKTLSREGDQTNLMLLAAVVMLLFNPYILSSDVGFQLSFLAFAGLIYLSPIVKKFVERSKLKIMPEYFRLSFTETLAAQIAVFPLILVVFGRVSLIGPISNVLILWIIPWAMALVFIAGLFGLIFYPLGKIAVIFAWPALLFIIKSVEFLAKIPAASLEMGKNNWLLGLLLYLILIISAVIMSRRFKLKLL